MPASVIWGAHIRACGGAQAGAHGWLALPGDKEIYERLGPCGSQRACLASKKAM